MYATLAKKDVFTAYAGWICRLDLALAAITLATTPCAFVIQGTNDKPLSLDQRDAIHRVGRYRFMHRTNHAYSQYPTLAKITTSRSEDFVMNHNWSLTKTFDFEGQSVAYDVAGQGEPVVLVHGTPFSSHVWRHISRELARDFQVFAYDLLGYGQSEKRDGQDVSLGIQNIVLAALIEHWNIERPKIICHDFGGATALRAHIMNRCEFEKLLMFDPVAIRPWGSPFVQHVKNYEAAFAGVPGYLQQAILRAYIRGAINRPVSDTELEPYVAPWLGSVGQAAFYRQIAQMDLRYTDEIQDRFEEIRCPVMLLWGTEDEWIPLERGRELARMIPGVELIEIPGSGHLMQEDAPEAIVSAALRFFR